MSVDVFVVCVSPPGRNFFIAGWRFFVEEILPWIARIRKDIVWFMAKKKTLFDYSIDHQTSRSRSLVTIQVSLTAEQYVYMLVTDGSRLSECQTIYTSVFSHQKTLPKEFLKVLLKYKPPVHFSKAKLSCYSISTPNHLNLLTFLPSNRNLPKKYPKNPAYGRHWTSWRVGIVAPILRNP